MTARTVSFQGRQGDGEVGVDILLRWIDSDPREFPLILCGVDPTKKDVAGTGI
jgi:hypothetical protein